MRRLFLLLLLLLTPSISAAAGCNSSVAPALKCPAGYLMTCSSEGYDHWVCAKLQSGLVEMLGDTLPKENTDAPASVAPTPVAAPSKKPAPKAEPRVATSTARETTKQESPKPQTGNATSAAAHARNEARKEAHVSFWESLVGSIGTTSTSSPKFLSNKYFAQLFKSLFGL